MSGCVAFFETLSTDSIDLEDPTEQRLNLFKRKTSTPLLALHGVIIADH
jgi:hypothetical protein